LWQTQNKDKKEFVAKSSTGIIAGITGLLFALLYVGLEILTENPEATHSISIWHFPLIWLLAGIFFYLVFYAVGTVRYGKVKERTVTFSFSVAVALSSHCSGYILCSPA